jgi:outer membrane protein insertion porin family
LGENRPEPGKYILGGVTVSGKISYNENTVVNFTGLEKGQYINVPGEEISAAIKKLWRLNLFSDVNFYVNDIRNDSIFLDLNIIELPKLSDVKIQGKKR